MNLRSEILAEHSKKQTEKIISWIGDSQQRFDELVNLFLSDENTVVQRSGWPLSYIAVAHPQLVKKHLPVLVKTLHKEKIHNSVKRNIVRFLQEVPLPEELHGEIMDLCFGFITDLQEATSVKVFSLSVLEHLSKQYPEIIHELTVIIEERWDYETAGFHSRARKILNTINKKGKI